MFDGLTDKLGQFQEDVEAEAEAAEADAAAGDAATAAEPEPDANSLEEEPASDDTEADRDAADDVGFAKKAALAATGRTVITESELEGPLEQLELELLKGDVEMGEIGRAHV